MSSQIKVSDLLFQWMRDNSKAKQLPASSLMMQIDSDKPEKKAPIKPLKLANRIDYIAQVLDSYVEKEDKEMLEAKEGEEEERKEKADEPIILLQDTVVEIEEIKTIKSLQFGLLSPDEIRLQSVCNVTKHRLFENGAPVVDGLYDLRMGSTQRQFECTSCTLPFKDCPGHFGRIELACPIFNYLHIEKIIKLLNTVCLDCSALLVPKTKRFIERQAQCKRGVDRLRIAHDLVKSKTTNKQCCGTDANLRHYLPINQLKCGVACAPERGAAESSSNVLHPIQALEQGCGHYQPKVMREGHQIKAKYPSLPASASGVREAKKQAKEAERLAKKQAKELERQLKLSGKKRKMGEEALEKSSEMAEAEEKQVVVPNKQEEEYDLVRKQRAETERILDAAEVLRIFQRISEEDCWLLGFDPHNGHPAWMIFTVLPVPPPVIRPPVITPMGRKAITHDELTMTLIEIVKNNNKLRKQIQGNIQTYQENYKLLLCNSVVAMIDNDGKIFTKAVISNSSQIPRQGIAQRLKGKTGRIRGNLMGKRTDFSARSVITPDANLALNEVGVPIEMALILTYPERVNRFNIDRLQTAVLLGPHQIAGAKFVCDNHGQRWDLQYNRDIKLEIGFVVERHLRNRDVVTMNRQPSLHKESIMAFYVVLMPGKTFRLNLSVTTPFNADFDGDEMNLGLPQSEEARAELVSLLEVSRCLITPQTNKPSMGLVQDSLLATRLLTMRDAFLTRSQVMHLLMYAPISFADMRLPQPAIVKPEPLWTGKQLVSLLMPESLTLELSANKFKPDDEPKDSMTPSDCCVAVKNGTLLSGVLDKKFVGVQHGSIIHILTKDCGGQAARIFLEQLQGIAQAYVTTVRGFSVGLADCIPPIEIQKRVNQTMIDVDLAARQVVRDYEAATLQIQPGKTAEQTFENNLTNLFQMAHAKSGRMVQEAMPLHGNNLNLMITAGSKGATVNIAQIAGSVGQQNLNGGRIPCHFKDRAMPHSLRNDLYDFESRGWIDRSFVQGLRPTQLQSHACGGREGLLDTAVKTADIGYKQRRLVKAGEDVSVAHDGTVRNSVGRIVQFSYGDDGMDGACFEWQPIDFLSMNNAEIESTYGPTGDPFCSGQSDWHILEEQVQKIIAFRDEIREAVYPSTEKNFPLPNNLMRSIGHALDWQKKQTKSETIVSVADAAQLLTDFESRLLAMIDNAKLHGQRSSDSISMYIALVYNNLSPNLVRHKHCLSKSSLQWLFFEHLLPQLVKSRVAPGEASGVLAAQAIGEPATQMTFNSVTRDTVVIFTDNDQPHRMAIGDWIDAEMARLPNEVKIVNNDTDYLDLVDKKIMIPTCDKDGNSSWQHLTAVTRHPPRGDLIKIKTRSGRSVTVSKCKSLLVYSEVTKKLEHTAGADIKIGDLVPCTVTLQNQVVETQVLDVSRYLSKKEWTFGTDLHKAHQLWVAERSRDGGCNVRKGWLATFQDQFTLPFARFDSAVVSFRTKINLIQPGFVYPKFGGKIKSQIPDKIPLDQDFGFFVGAYLAEGCATTTFVDISNNNDAYRQRISNWCDKYNIGWRTVNKHNDRYYANAQPGHNITIHSTLMAALMISMCNTGSANKKVPAEAFTASDDFVRGLLDGYMSGDGCVSKQDMIEWSSVSEQLTRDIAFLAYRFGIFGRFHTYQQKKNNVGSLVILPAYKYSISCQYAVRWAENITSVIDYKQERLDSLHAKRAHNEDFGIAYNRHLNDMVLDSVVSVEMIPEALHQFVYDVTVPTTLNFIVANGMALLDSFHSSGKTNMQLLQGVPRLEELIKVGGHIKTPSMSLYLLNAEKFAIGEKAQQRAGARARLLAGKLSSASLGSIIAKSEILHEPIHDTNRWLSGERDRQAVESWYAYEPPTVKQARVEQFGEPLDYVIRLQVSRKAAHERSLTPSAIARLISIAYEGSVEAIPSDDNDWFVDDDNDGGFVRVRLYAHATYHSLIASLPSFLRDSIYTLQDLQTQKNGTAVEKDSLNFDATTTPVLMRTKKRKVAEESGNGAASVPNSENSVYMSAVAAEKCDENQDMIKEMWGKADARICIPIMLQHFEKHMLLLPLDKVDTITDANVRQVPMTIYDQETGGQVKKAQEWIIETYGSNLKQTLTLHGIDHTRTRCNNPAETAAIFGIEAARTCLFRELRNVLQFNGEYVNYRHIEMLCDIMTQSGSLMAVNRHGLNRRQTGPIPRATLEESVTVLASAGCFSEYDPLTGPSERVATGRRIHSGSGTHIDVIATKEDPADLPSNAHSLSRLQIRKARNAAAAPTHETSAFARGYDANEKFSAIALQKYMIDEEILFAKQQEQHTQDSNLWLSARPSADLLKNPFTSNMQVDASNDDQDNAEKAAVDDLQNPFTMQPKDRKSEWDDLFAQHNADFSVAETKKADRPVVIGTSVPEAKRIKLYNPFASDENVYSFALTLTENDIEKQRQVFYVASEPREKGQM